MCACAYPCVPECACMSAHLCVGWGGGCVSQQEIWGIISSCHKLCKREKNPIYTKAGLGRSPKKSKQTNCTRHFRLQTNAFITYHEGGGDHFSSKPTPMQRSLRIHCRSQRVELKVHKSGAVPALQTTTHKMFYNSAQRQNCGNCKWSQSV